MFKRFFKYFIFLIYLVFLILVIEELCFLLPCNTKIEAIFTGYSDVYTDTDVKYFSRYSYEYDGKNFEEIKPINEKNFLEDYNPKLKGDICNIYINPSNPEEIIDLGFNNIFFVLKFIVLSGFSLYYIFLFFKNIFIKNSENNLSKE